MSPYDDEFPDLTDDLRRSRPQADPLPSAFNRQLRAALIKEAETMNMTNTKTNNWATALGTLAVVIAMPILFWTLMNTQRPEAPMAGSAPLVEAEDEVEPTDDIADEDYIEIVDVSPQQIGDQVTAAVTVSYTLVSAAESTGAVFFTVPHEGGEFYGGIPFELLQGSGTIMVDVVLPNFAVDEAGQLRADVAFKIELNLSDEKLTSVTGLPLLEDDDNFAVIKQIGAARLPAEVTNAEGMLEIPVTFAFELTDHVSGTVHISYSVIGETAAEDEQIIEEVVDDIGVDESPVRSVLIGQGSGTGEVFLLIPEELVNADGSLADNVALLLELALDTAGEPAIDVDGVPVEELIGVIDGTSD